MILYNGSTGSLGAYFAPAAEARRATVIAFRSRLEAREDSHAELRTLPATERVVFVSMAAKVSVPECERDPDGARKTNVTDTVATVADVLAWSKERGLPAAVLYVSSGHVYAAQPAGVALEEEHPTAPRSVYARTKLEAEQSLSALADRAGVSLLIARVFSVMAPHQALHYALPGLIRRASEDRLEGIPGLSHVRDYLDARDICDILLELALRPKMPQGILNVCSGRPTCLRHVVEAIVHRTQPLKAERLISKITEAPARPDDVAWVLGNPARLVSILGRDPQRIPWIKTVEEAVQSLAEQRSASS